MPRSYLRPLLVSALLGISPICAQTAPAPTTTLAVDSPAFVFSPGNWTGDQGRAGSVYRQSWNPGAYFRVTWTTTNTAPVADLLLDTSTVQQTAYKPQISYNIDGVWTAGVVCSTDDIKLAGLKGAGTHTLTVYFKASEQKNRWVPVGSGSQNILRVKGLLVDAGSTAEHESPAPHWALIIGDSITEGIQADFGKDDNLSDWSFLVGRGLQTHGYEYSVSACGYSGWVRPGDGTGDVLPYYFISGSNAGSGGTYDDTKSRWNKIDGQNHSLLDANQHLSAYGETSHEPSLILINYGTNDALKHANSSDIEASITQSLTALRGAAPNASIYLIMPFGHYSEKELQDGLAAYKTSAPGDQKVFMIDLGKTVANTLAAGGYWGGLHPNLRGHAVFANQIMSQISIP